MGATITSLTIDHTLPVRGVPFESLRDLLVSVAPRGVIQYTDALNLVIEKEIILSAHGKRLRKSAFYHYWTALRMLGMIEQEPATKRYRLASRGTHLIEVAGKHGTPLNKEEQAIFRQGMLANQRIWDNFLVLFTGQCALTQTPQVGDRVTFAPMQPKGYMLYSPHVLNPITLDAGVTQAIIFGLRRWGQQCGLIDEIFPPTTTQASKNVSSFMYLVDNRKDAELTLYDFTKLLVEYQRYGQVLYDSTIRFNIADLLTQLCPNEGIHLATATNLLVEWLAHFRQHASIERPSSGLVEEQRGHRNSGRTRESQPWLVKNGLVYTTLFVRRQILSEAG
jgi:hypothetical protein